MSRLGRAQPFKPLINTQRSIAQSFFPQIYSETVTLADSILRSVSRTLSELVTLTDVLTTVKVITLNLILETVTLSDTILKSITRNFTESITLTDTILRSISRTLTEALTLTATFLDVITKKFGLIIMRSQQQQYPIGMDESTDGRMRSQQQKWPIPMDENEIK